MTPYATLEDFKTWIELPPEDEGLMDHHLEPILDAASRWIDQQCGRTFSVGAAVTKLYNPSSPDYLDVVDLVAATSIKLDTDGDRTYTTTLAPADYDLLPYTDDTGQPSVRYTQVRIWPGSSHAFTPGELVQIVGTFGYVVDGETPSEVRLATLMLSSRWWKQHETPSGSAIVPDMGSFDRVSSENADIKALLDRYDRSSASAWVLV